MKKDNVWTDFSAKETSSFYTISACNTRLYHYESMSKDPEKNSRQIFWSL